MAEYFKRFERVLVHGKVRYGLEDVETFLGGFSTSTGEVSTPQVQVLVKTQPKLTLGT